MSSKFLDKSRPSFLDKKRITQKQAAAQAMTAARETKISNMDESARAFRDRMIRNRKQHEEAADTECWVALVFPTRADKDTFIEEFGLLDKPMIPGTPGNKYVDGNALACALRQSRKDHS